MKEKELRSVIRKHIKKMINEAGPRLGAGAGELERGLGKVSKRASRFTKRQRIQALIPVLKKFNVQVGDIPLIKSALVKLGQSEEAPKEENYTAGVDDGNKGESLQEAGLDSKSEKLDKSQAFQMLKKAVATKPMTQQVDFVIDLINKFNLDDSAKRKLKMQLKNMK